MKPQPMSDAEIDAAAKRLAECMDYPWEFMPEKGRENMRQHARTIVSPTIAARDAQWAAMIGEPVAVADMDLHADHMGPVEAFAFIPENTPLYAIKETP